MDILEFYTNVHRQVSKSIDHASSHIRENIDYANKEEGAAQTRYGSMKEELQSLAAARSDDIIKKLDDLTNLERMMGNKLPERRDEVNMGAVFSAYDEQTERLSYFAILPAGGGEIVDFGGLSIRIMSMGAPLARAFFGKEVDEEVAFNGKTYSIEEIF